MNYLTNLPEWKALYAHHDRIASGHMREWFAQNPDRSTQFLLKENELLLDYSRNRIDQQTIKLLCELAQAIGLNEKITAQFAGHPINNTEKRAVLHTALRAKNNDPLLINGSDIFPLIQAAQIKLWDFVANIHHQNWCGVSGKPIKHIVNIGIGGSYLGPKLGVHALKDFAVTDLQFHFISTIDTSHLHDVLEKIDPETTLFIISSKSFSTLETLTNARSIIAWMEAKLGSGVLTKHFVAVTAATEKAIALGIPAENIFPLWDWVGGRYSIWSPIGLPLMLMLGKQQFAKFLEGAFQADQHFQTAAFDKNIPVLLALLGIWYTNFFAASAHAIIPYAYRLRYLVPYLQQADMESNGKNVAASGEQLHYATSPVIFGDEGCRGQHSYHQLLHQGHQLIPADFIIIGKPPAHIDEIRHDMLLASGLSQAHALMRGKTRDEAYQDLLRLGHTEAEAHALSAHQVIPGNKPSNILFLERLTPYNLGMLIAMYEHKIFVQGAIWGINSYDQWGVELGKELLPIILACIKEQSAPDHAMSGFINYLKKIRNKL